MALAVLPFALAGIGTAWVRITNLAILFVLLSLGLNIVVGFAGLLDLGYIAFYAVGAYVYALLASPHFNLHLPFWIILPIGAAVACLFGVLLGAPTLKLRGDYLAIVTLGFGEIIRIFLNNLSQPVNLTNGPQGITLIDPFRIGSFSFAQRETILGLAFTGPIKYYYFLVLLVIVIIVINLRLQNSRIGRAWEAIREDEIAARAMGINTRNMKLLAFAMGASFGGISGGIFSATQGFISPESFVLVESIMVLSMVVLGGMGNIWGVILGAVLLSFVPEVLRYTVEPVQRALFGRMLIEPEVIRMLLFGLALVLMMLFRPAGILPSALRKRELEGKRVQREDGRCRPRARAARGEGHQQALRRRARARRRRLHDQPRRDLRPDRPQRRRQDQPLQRAHRHLSADGGEFMFDGLPLAGLKPNEVAARGIARTFQNIRLFANLSALENVMIGRHVRTHAERLRRDLPRREDARRGDGDREARPRAARVRRRREARQHARQAPRLRRPAPAGDRPRARDGAEAARARRAGGRHERHRDRVAQGPARRHPPRRHDDPADRARHEARDERLRPRAGARLRQEDRRGIGRRRAEGPEGDRRVPRRRSLARPEGGR